MFNYRNRFVYVPFACLLAIMTSVGCQQKKDNRQPVVSIEGKVLYQGKPLQFGEVVFYPDRGPPARGNIGSDGTFRLSTYGRNDGAMVGKHRVEITCCENQRPGTPLPKPEGEGPVPLGKSLIPQKFAGAKSELKAEVKLDNNAPFNFDLK